MKVAVIGSRTFQDYPLLEAILDEEEITTIVSGGARGADTLAEQYAKAHNILFEVHRPDWNQYGKRAGFIRNKDIISSCDKVIAFWDGESKGTAHSIDIAQYQKKPVRIVSI